MKKVLFSAIALVAFTATSIAREIDETKNSKKAEKIENTSQKNEEITLKARDCEAERQIAYLAAMGDGFSSADASGMAYHIYFWCMGSKFELTAAN